ncbi:MAG: hypothetical protein AABY22_33565 [Nanoarchaeota archaeon]
MTTKFMNTCPVTNGLCFNPLCMFGCIENQRKKYNTKAILFTTLLILIIL